jgi:hypothetical protein
MIPNMPQRAAQNYVDRGRDNKTLVMTLAHAQCKWYHYRQRTPGDLFLTRHLGTYSPGVRRTELRIDQVYPLHIEELGQFSISNYCAVYIPSLYARNVRNAMSRMSPVNMSQLINFDQEKIKCRTKIAVNNSEDCHAWNLRWIAYSAQVL